MLISHTHIHSAEVHRHFHRYRFSWFFFNLLKPSTIREIFITTNHSICKISQFLWFKNAIPTLPLVSITLEFTQILITPFFLSIAYPNPHPSYIPPPQHTHAQRYMLTHTNFKARLRQKQPILAFIMLVV